MNNDQNSPILALEHNVTWALENATPYAGRRLADAVANELMSLEIGLNCDSTTAPPKGPFLYRPRKSWHTGDARQLETPRAALVLHILVDGHL